MRHRRADFLDYAERIKSAVSIRDVLNLNGIRVNRQGFAICPFHGDTDASLKVYEGGRGWTCYGCHKGGDVINLAMNLYGLGFQDAIKKLNEEFDIGIDFDAPINERDSILAAARVAARKAKLRKEKEEEENIEKAYWEAFDEWRRLDLEVLSMEPLLDSLDHFPAEFVRIVNQRNQAYEKLKNLEGRRLKYE